jgi:hypothetical protein
MPRLWLKSVVERLLPWVQKRGLFVRVLMVVVLLMGTY